MSGVDFLEKLLDGVEVEWKALGEVTEYSKTRIDFNLVNKENYVGVDNLLQNRAGKTNSSYVPTEGRLIEYCIGDILIGNIRPYLKKIWHADRPGGTNGDVLVIHPTHDALNSRYLYQALTDDKFFAYNMQHAKGAKMPRGDKTKILEYNIPIPCPENPKKSLEIQAEIVRILDAFTALTAELTAELGMRKKQYNYYRDQLLSFEYGAPLLPLSQCCKSISDGDHQAPQKTENGIPFITISDVSATNQIDFNNTKFVSNSYYDGLDCKRKARTNDILYTVVGSFGIPVYIDSDKKFAFQRHIAILRPNPAIVISKYLYHVLRSSNVVKQANIVATGAAQKTITLTALNRMQIAVPPLGEQARIVAILDKFDAITNSITEGLPREIELRQQQYAYYRDLLLSFPKPEADA